MYFAKLLLLKIAIYVIALFWAWTSTLKLLYNWARYGNKFWEVKKRTLPPQCLQDPAYGRHSYIKLKLQDIKLHYVENGDHEKPLMLLLHGFPEFWFSWRHQLKYFAKTHWVVAVDMRGYGDSDKPTGVSSYSPETLQRDIVELVKGLGRKDCTLVAHDWGGSVAWGVAANFPEVVSKLITLNAPHPTAFRLLVKSSFAQFLKAWYMFMFQLPYFPEIFMYTEDLSIFTELLEKTIRVEELEAYKYTFGQKDLWTPPINYYRSFMNGILSERASGDVAPLPTIKMPTLIIWGDSDPALERNLPELARPYIQNLKINYISKGSHFIQTDKPVEVNKLIEAFV